MMSQLAREGSPRKGLEVFASLPSLGVAADTAAANAAISACDKSGAWQAALDLFASMARAGLMASASPAACR